MSSSAKRYRVINQRDQPTELHCGGRVVVLAARATVELSEREISEPQLAGLARRGLLSLHALPDPPTARPPAAKTRRRAASKKVRGGKAK